MKKQLFGGLLILLSVALTAQEQKAVERMVQLKYVQPVAAVTLGTPSVYESGHWGYLSGAMAFQHSSRLNPYRNWENPDFNAAAYVGLGNPHKWLGLGLSFNLLGLSNTNGAENNFGESSVDIQISRAITKHLHVGGGIFNALQLNPTPINTLRTYYLQLGGLLSLRPRGDQAFSTVFFNVGVGNGRFQKRESFLSLRNESMRVFGSAAIQVVPRLNLIAEWTGAELALATASFPFRKINLHIMTGFSDLNFEKHRWLVVIGYAHLFRSEKYQRQTGAGHIYTQLIAPQ